ncbi:MAG: STAS domain-containing protein [bacterium]|jgi:anti-sigma B factor antagonist|nr:STAS domain-containing protein [bacterium]
MTAATPAAADILVMRPILKIAGGQIQLAWWDGRAAERPIRSLAVSGDPDHDWPELFDETARVLASGGRRFILDLDRVPWMNSRGLGRLVALWKNIDEGGGRLVVVCGNERIRNILHISQLEEVLRPWTTMAEASLQFPMAPGDSL